jgi:phosphohistidine phosphatase SixA
MAPVDRFILLRHARAGRKLRDRPKDFSRRLDRKGGQVALVLPELIMSYLVPEMILCSPFRRCVQTVEPLADRLGLRVVEDERFTPDRSTEAVRKAFVDVAANSVVCTHGEVIAQLFDEPVRCAKGAFWIVDRRGDTFNPNRYVEAP